MILTSETYGNDFDKVSFGDDRFIKSIALVCVSTIH